MSLRTLLAFTDARQVVALIATASLGAAGVAAGHEEIEIRLRELAERIAASPADATLYLRRADLHRRHRDWERARVDLAKARRLQPDHPDVPFVHGRMLLDEGRPREVLELVDRHQVAEGEGVASGALALLEARAARRLNEWDRALAAYRVACRTLQPPSPDHYLEAAAAALEAPGATGAQGAVAILDAARARLGFVPVLEARAYELERSAGATEAALKRCRRVLKREGPRRPDWELACGDTLAVLGRTEEAARAYRSVLRFLDDLPAARRRSAAMERLASRAAADLRELGEGSAGGAE